MKVGEIVGHADVNGPVMVMVIGKDSFLGAYLDDFQEIHEIHETGLRRRFSYDDEDDSVLGWSWFNNEGISHEKNHPVNVLLLRDCVENSDIAKQLNVRPKLGVVEKDKLKICSKGLMVNLSANKFVLVKMDQTQLKEHAREAFKSVVSKNLPAEAKA